MLKNPPSFVLRPAQASDAVGLVAVMTSIYDENRWFVGDGPPEWEQLAKRLRTLDPSREMLLVAVSPEETHAAHSPILGWIDVRRLAYRRVAHVANLTLAVAKQARGNGVGRSMLRAIEPWARRVGVEKLRLDVRASNHPAIALYESEGFEREGCEHRFVRDETGYDDNLTYGKFLTRGV